MQKVFDIYTDPGHGWMAIKKQLLVNLEIASKITSFSYQRGDTAYLEEDCDISIFFDAYLKHTGEKSVFKEHHTDKQSKIRSYDSYCFEVISARDFTADMGVNLNTSPIERAARMVC
ncbi:MAG: hypothetical protein ABL865_06780 [Candidatus Nitrotoga sp.]